MPVTLYISVLVGVDPVILPYGFNSKYFSKDWPNHNVYRVQFAPKNRHFYVEHPLVLRVINRVGLIGSGIHMTDDTELIPCTYIHYVSSRLKKQVKSFRVFQQLVLHYRLEI